MVQKIEWVNLLQGKQETVGTHKAQMKMQGFDEWLQNQLEF